MKFKNLLKVLIEKQEMVITVYTDGSLKEFIFTNTLDVRKDRKDILEFKVYKVFSVKTDSRMHIYLEN